ncbi:MAG: DUF2939 domain-containing protein [Brevundimonas sp.]|uniref:DUF2939 domain-containing protein n=1 Tax=Brevundimonas sp. TaxID=1871086 RepID=UPI00184A2327|nr:DUF2939 domain-containing protein [Brevundimonas sp.]MBA4804630.1 DUF2939 domain-containing protein [Brevundimonas sp.]
MKIIGNLLLLALVVAVISFFAAPAVAFLAIRSAADARDAAALARLIDYPAVRQSLRPQLAGDAAARAPAPSFLEDPIGAVRRQFEAGTVPAEDVDAYLTPAALAGLTRGEGRFARQRAAGGAAARGGDPTPSPVYWGVNRARLAVSDEGGSRTIFTFERRGPFEWRLAHIGLPDGAAPVPPPRGSAAPAGAARAG